MKQATDNFCGDSKISHFFSLLGKADKKEYLNRYLTFALSPVLKGIKPAELVTLKASCSCLHTWRAHSGEIAANMGLSFFELCASETSVSLLWFEPEAFAAVLARLKNNPLFCAHRYPTGQSVGAMLYRLKGRFAEGDFPHEIGLFLGYAERDVDAFIAQGGQNYCICRYWKVYHNKEGANRIFNEIDRVREMAADLLAQGEPVQTTIRAIQTA